MSRDALDVLRQQFASVSFSRSVTVDTSALNMLATVFADKGGEYLVPFHQTSAAEGGGTKFGEVRLFDEALKLLGKGSEQEIAAFSRMCGDSVVVTIREGGRLDSLLKLQTFSRDEKRKLAAEFSAKGPMGSGSASINAEMQKKVDHNQFEFEYNQAGGNADETPTDATTLLKKLASFGKKEGFESRPYEIYTLSYKSLRNWPGNVKIPSPQELDLWANLYWRYMNLLNEYATAALNPDRYLYIAHKTRDDLFAEYDRVLDASSFLDATLYKCVSAKICELDKALTAVLADLSRKHTIQTSSGETWMPTGPNLASILETTFGVRQVLASLTTQTTVSLQDISVRPLLYGMFLSLATTFDGQLIARAQPYCAVYDDGTKSCGIPPAA